jgi:hypothetical protein
MNRRNRINGKEDITMAYVQRITPEQIEQARALHAQGKTVGEIADAIGWPARKSLRTLQDILSTGHTHVAADPYEHTTPAEIPPAPAEFFCYRCGKHKPESKRNPKNGTRRASCTDCAATIEARTRRKKTPRYYKTAATNYRRGKLPPFAKA